jgi:alginate O-acetyltransferase complex protein AlgI
MSFTSLPFVAFLLAILIAFYIVPRPWRRYLLLAASLFFYMCWNAKFVVLLLALISVDYFAALWIANRSGAARRAALILSLAANLSFLGWFKYANFARGIAGYGPLDIILPLGISFHTFQSISYVVDVYRKEQEPVRSFWDYALFVSFFPQLVAGPIVRAREFFGNLWHWHAPTSVEWNRAILYICTGYVKKLLFADHFALVADRYFNAPQSLPGSLPAVTATLAFALQIFFDFSGYTDIAIGCGLLFGFHFPENFRRPYLAAGITEFWRRWHMSLSRWLRDYVYIPLGGNRKGRTYLNLLLTMLIGGLWHGASWNFVIWGGYHGVLLCLERMIFGRGERKGIARVPFALLTFSLVSAGWIFFRARTLDSAVFVLSQLVSPVRGASLLTPWHWRLAVLSLAIALAEEYGHWLARLELAPAWARASVVALVLLAIELFGVTEEQIPFVYFQF